MGTPITAVILDTNVLKNTAEEKPISVIIFVYLTYIVYNTIEIHNIIIVQPS